MSLTRSQFEELPIRTPDLQDSPARYAGQFSQSQLMIVTKRVLFLRVMFAGPGFQRLGKLKSAFRTTPKLNALSAKVCSEIAAHLCLGRAMALRRHPGISKFLHRNRLDFLSARRQTSNANVSESVAAFVQRLTYRRDPWRDNRRICGHCSGQFQLACKSFKNPSSINRGMPSSVNNRRLGPA